MKIIKYLSTSMIITLLSISIILAQKEQENKSTSNCCEQSKTNTSINKNFDNSLSSPTKETKNQQTQLHQNKDQSESNDCCSKKDVDNTKELNKDSDKNIPQKECCNMKSEKKAIEGPKSGKSKNSKN